MSGIRFCSECLNILHPEESKNDHRLLFVCRSCDYREYTQDTNSIEDNMIYQRDFIQSFTEASIDPDFCLDPSMPRENIICPNCRYHEATYLIDREPGDRYLRKVYICARTGKTGKPECRHFFMPVKYQKINLDDQKPETYAYREYGSEKNQVLIMLHGNYTSSYIFEKTFMKFAEAFRVIAPDMRGFGLSSYATKLKSFDDLAKDLHYFLKDMKIDKCSVLGWDIGACVALKFAAQYPGSIDKLILVSPVSLTGKTYIKDPDNDEIVLPEWSDDIDAALNDRRLKEIQHAFKVKDKAFLETFYLTEFYTHKMPEQERLNSYIENFVNQNNLPDIIRCLLNYNITRDKENNGTGEIEAIETETLILCGQDDFRTPWEEAKEIKDILGGLATIKVFSDAGHCLFEDHFEDFIKAVAAFCYQ